MSNKSVFINDYSKYYIHESSDFPKMSEHLTDSNILKSRKTYLRKRESGSLSVCSENSGSFSAIAEELCAEKNYKCAASITSCSYSKNNYQKDVDSEFSLFSDEVTDYQISGSADNLKDDVSSILGTVSSGSNYQRTRKNLKNQINNEQNNSEEIFNSSLHEKNSNSGADAANDFLNPNQATFSVNQSSLLSKNSEANHTRINKSDGCANELPQKSTVQVAKKPVPCFGRANFFENPLINQSVFSLIDLVKKFSVPRNVACSKNNPTSKKIEESELAPLKKESVANSASSPKINSFDKKTLKSTVSVRKSSKNVILKSDVINADKLSVKKGDVKTPSKSIQKRNIGSFDKIEESVDMIGCVRNTDIPKKNGAKIPSKAVQRENIKKSMKVLKKYVFKKKIVRNNVKAKIKSSITRTSSNLHLVRNGTTGKIQSDCDGKRIEKLSSLHNTTQNQFLNTIPTIFALKPPVSQETTPLFVRSVNTSVADIHSIQNDNQAVLCGNFDDLAVPCSSTLSNNHSSFDANTFLVNPVHHKQKVRTGSLMSHSVSIEQRVNRYFQRTENMCILRKQEIAVKIFSRRRSLQDLTVSKFCNSPQITVVFSDYLDDFVSIPPNYHDDNKGYDFPENFETENLLSVVKDFVHSIIFCIIPKDGPKPLYISYLQIINAAVHKMSVRENAIVLQVFGKNSSLENSFENITFKLDDVLSKLNFVALLVIFHEYKSRQITSNI